MITLKTEHGVTQSEVHGGYVEFLCDIAISYNSLIRNISKETGFSETEVYIDTLEAIKDVYEMRQARKGD